MHIDLKNKLRVIANDWWEGLHTTDICSVLEIKEHSILITNGIVKREIPRTMLPEDFELAE